MIPSEITPGRRARLCVTKRGRGYVYGTISDFDGENVLLDMDSGSAVVIPWYEIIETDRPVKTMDAWEGLGARLMEESLIREVESDRFHRERRRP